MNTRPKSDDEIRATVMEGYSKIAGGEVAFARAPAAGGCCGPNSTACTPSSDPTAFAKSIGYSAEELALLPEGVNLGLSCGNPAAIAALEPGQWVLDLGSGAGMDAFLAGPKVGSRGRVIGVDMTPAMLQKARANARNYEQRTGLQNVEFRLGEIEHLPLADASVDVVLSNCVLNLSPNKRQVWREIARVLRPGGRVAISDLALLRPLPAEVEKMVEALVGCVAGAVLVSETEESMRAAGLIEVRLTPKPEYVASVMSFEDPLYLEILRHLPKGLSPADYITSLDIAGKKPLLRQPSRCC